VSRFDPARRPIADARGRLVTIGLISGVALAWIVAARILPRRPEPEPCTNRVKAEVVSPDGQFRAVVFNRYCPDSDRTSTNISVLSASEQLPDGNGNVFASDVEIAVRVGWRTDRKLTVYSFADLGQAKRVEQVGHLAIEYSQIMETDLLPPLETSPTPSPPAGGAARED
jgi:hypothetical protein